MNKCVQVVADPPTCFFSHTLKGMEKEGKTADNFDDNFGKITFKRKE